MSKAVSKAIFEKELDRRISRARLSGAMHNYTQAEFKNYLLGIGLEKYEKVILPVETEGKYPSTIPDQGAKIIPFPGVSLPEPDGFQNRLDAFLHEMGYIE
jgi:hypothetical protein